MILLLCYYNIDIAICIGYRFRLHGGQWGEGRRSDQKPIKDKIRMRRNQEPWSTQLEAVLSV